MTIICSFFLVSSWLLNLQSSVDHKARTRNIKVARQLIKMIGVSCRWSKRWVSVADQNGGVSYRSKLLVSVADQNDCRRSKWVLSVADDQYLASVCLLPDEPAAALAPVVRENPLCALSYSYQPGPMILCQCQWWEDDESLFIVGAALRDGSVYLQFHFKVSTQLEPDAHEHPFIFEERWKLGGFWCRATSHLSVQDSLLHFRFYFFCST